MSKRPELFHWQPDNGKNFGDELSVVVVNNMLERHNLEPITLFNKTSSLPPAQAAHRLLAVGSILHFSRSDDTVWGTGLRHNFVPLWKANQLSVRAVRGPITRNFLLQNGTECPEIYGDPALLLKDLDAKLFEMDDAVDRCGLGNSRACVIPNLRQREQIKFTYENDFHVINPLDDYSSIINNMKKFDIVVSSSLHGLIIGDLLNKPIYWLNQFPLDEGTLKFEDYFAGTGRTNVLPCSTVKDAFKTAPIPAIVNLDEICERLKRAFPVDIFMEPNM